MDFPKAIRNIILIVLVMLIFDALVISLWAPHLRENLYFFAGKSKVHMLSDFLFGEGVILLGFGALFESGFSEKQTAARYLLITRWGRKWRLSEESIVKSSYALEFCL